MSFLAVSQYVIYKRNVPCVKKLIEKRARLDKIGNLGMNLWTFVARMGSVGLLKCMFEHGFDKEDRDCNGRSLLSYVVKSFNVDAVRYLLDLGVTMTSGTIRANEMSCKHCRKSRLLIDTTAEDKIQDPHIDACQYDMLDVVQLMEEYGNQSFKSMNALRRAVIRNMLKVTEYLLGKYNYSLNVEYARKCGEKIDYQTILIEACKHNAAHVIA